MMWWQEWQEERSKKTPQQDLVNHARKLAVTIKEKYQPSGHDNYDVWTLAIAVQSLCNALQAGGFVR